MNGERISLVVALFGASLQLATIAIGVANWTAVARIALTEFLRIHETGYVIAQRTAGAGNPPLIFRVIIPNASAPIVVQATLMVSSAIPFAAGLSFLDLSDPNVASCGQIIGSNRHFILDASFNVTIPGSAIFVTALAISLVGDGMNARLTEQSERRQNPRK